MMSRYGARSVKWLHLWMPFVAFSLLLVALVLTPSAGAAVLAGWHTASPMPTARYHLAAAPGDDGRLYAIGGFGGVNDSTVEAYTPSSNSWVTVSSLPHGRAVLTAAQGGDGRVYAIGGYDPNCDCYTNEVDAYSSSTNSWTTVTPMPTPRSAAAAATGSNGKIYVFGGYNDVVGTTIDTLEIYTPSSNSWTTGAPMPTPRDHMTAVTASSGNIYVIGGYDGHTGRLLNTVEKYNPVANSWTTKTSMPTPRDHLAGARGSDGRIYAIGGSTDTELASNIVEAYDPAHDSWTIAASLPTPREGLAAAAVAGNVYAAGGYGSDYSAALEYLPEQIPPVGTVSINGGASSTDSLSVSVDVPATDTSGISRVRLSSSPATSGGLLSASTTYTFHTPIAWDLSDPSTGGNSSAGTHTVYAQWKDRAGNWSDVSSDSITYGSGGPVVSGINNALTSTPITPAGKVPETTTWVGTDQEASITSYRAQLQTDGGPWRNLTLTSPTATSVDVTLAPGSTYNFQIQATDSLDRTSAWTQGVAFRVNAFQENAASYTGTWTDQSLTGAWGGAVTYTKAKSASATITFTGRNLAWVGTKGANYGSASVYVDGVLVKTINCYASATAKRQFLMRYSTGELTNSTHTVQIVNLATVGHPRIDVDGFVSLQS